MFTHRYPKPLTRPFGWEFSWEQPQGVAGSHYMVIIISLNSAIIAAREGLDNAMKCIKMLRRISLGKAHCWTEMGKQAMRKRAPPRQMQSCQSFLYTSERKGKERQIKKFIVNIHSGISLQGYFIYAVAMSKSPFSGWSIYHFFILWQKVLCHCTHPVLPSVQSNILCSSPKRRQ